MVDVKKNVKESTNIVYKKVLFPKNMFEDMVEVCDDGTAHGHVLHRTRLSSCPAEYTLEMENQGREHPKHVDSYRLLPIPPGFRLAGQDVYGHTERSIVVCDGHGPNGVDMAIQAAAMASDVEEILCGPIINAYSTERDVREVVMNRLLAAPETRSGATYVQMVFHQWRHRRWVITINVGDSEALIVDQRSVLQCSVPHNWDNYEVYRRYVSTCSGTPQPVCYNRWNTGKYKMSGPDGSNEPIMLYNEEHKPHMENAIFVQQKMARKNYPFGTQSVRMFSHPYENWGSCVCVNNRALGQLVVCYGDKDEHAATGAPFEMVHVYIHELASDEDVSCIVQSDGVSNRMTLQECAVRAFNRNYLPETSHDDMSVVKARWRPNTKIPYPTR